MDLARYAALFLTESREHLGACNELLLEWERHPTAPDPVDGLFRAVHTVKGMAATMGYTSVAELAHRTENLLDTLRAREQVPTAATFELLFRAVDALAAGAEAAVAGGDEPPDAALLAALDEAAGQKGPAGTVPYDRVDEVSSRGGSAAAGVSPGAATVTVSAETPERWRRARHIRVDRGRLDTLMRSVGELVVARHRLAALVAAEGDSDLAETSARIARLASDIQEEVLAARLTPVGEVFQRFPRVVRDLAKGLGKAIRLDLEGEEIELDRSVLDEISEPLLHLVRNAADHGLEHPAEREAAGKAPEGRILLSATRERNSVVVRVTDDGRGVDRSAILARARREGVSDEIDIGSDEMLIRLLARPGLSTAAAVSDLSGRGVGIDVVMTRIRALGGTLEVRSAVREGTTFVLRVPLTLAIVRALLAEVGGERYALPLAYVSETVELDPRALASIRGRDALVVRDEVVPTADLRELVGAAGLVPSRRPVVILEVGERRTALIVDALIGQQEIVVEPFEAPREMSSVIGGATILADGMPTLILDAAAIL